MAKEETPIENKIDELQVTNKLDLSITKEDLLDIIVDKKLTSLENEIKFLEIAKQKIQEEKDKEQSKIKKAREKILEKYLRKY